MKIYAALGAGWLALGSYACNATAADYPARVVQIIVPVDAGGAADVTARTVAQSISEAAKQPFIVVNKPSVSGILGAKVVADSAPDGYNILFSASTLTSAPYMMSDIGIDPEHDLKPITQVAISPFVIIVNSALPIKTLPDLIDFAKKNPGKFRWGVGGIGTPGYFAIVKFETSAGFSASKTPYKGEATALNAVMSGEVSGMLLSTAAAKSLDPNGPARLLALTLTEPSATFPGLPTVASFGFPGFEAASWFGLWGPKDLPQDKIDILHKLVVDATKTPKVEEFMTRTGTVAKPSATPADFAAYVTQNFRTNEALVKELKLKQP